MPVGASILGDPYPRDSVADVDSGFGVGFNIGAEVTRDGTPPRVAGILLIAGGTLAVLKLLGFRFNVGVSS